MIDIDLTRKRDAVLHLFRAHPSVLVALSGGVDSAVLLALAVEALGPERVLAATGSSPAVAQEDLQAARDVARRLGVRHEIVATHELDRPGYRANLGDRCYHCRTELFEALDELARREQLATVVYGAIVDDLGDHRPGMTAADQRGVIAPLLVCGLGKIEVRALAENYGLPVSDKPASPCLASRIPSGTEVTPERLGQVEQAEQGLRGLGFGQLRVRHHGVVARLELDAAGLRLLADPTTRAKAVRCVKQAGFRFVAVDLEEFRSGSLNVILGLQARSLTSRIESVPQPLAEQVASDDRGEQCQAREQRQPPGAADVLSGLGQ